MATTSPVSTTNRPAASGTDTDHGTRAQTPPRRVFAFTLFTTATILLMAAASAPSPFYPVLQARLGIAPVGITVIFAAYAIALLAALLTVGSLSDHVGRRPIIASGFVLLAASMLLFREADSLGMLIGARALQGVAGGALISALSAAVTDTAPPTRPQRAALMNTAAPMAGLALGALFSGLVLDRSSDALGIVFDTMTAAYLAVAALTWLAPETSARIEGWRSAFRPRVAVPSPARRPFALGLPMVVAGWATGGLVFALGPDIIHTELHPAGSLLPAAMIAVLPAAGLVAVVAMRGRSPRAIVVFASATIALGTAGSLVALTADAPVAYLVAVAVTGAGFGTAFLGVVGSLTPTVAAHQRAELFAALYTVSYLAFGVPTVVAGALASTLSLGTTALAYGGFVIACAITAGLVRALGRR